MTAPIVWNPFTDQPDYTGNGGGLGGDVVGPSSSVAGDFAVFADNTGKLLADLASPLDVAHGGTGKNSIASNAVLIGNGVGAVSSVSPTNPPGSLLQSSGTSAPPAYTSAIYPSSAQSGDLIYGSATNTYSRLNIGANNQILAVSSGIPAWTNASPEYLSWNNVTGTTQAIVVNNGYLANNASLVIFTLPATAVQFSKIQVIGVGAGGWKITLNNSQKITWLGSSSTVGTSGFIASVDVNACVTLRAVVGGAATFWVVEQSEGNINLG